MARSKLARRARCLARSLALIAWLTLIAPAHADDRGKIEGDAAWQRLVGNTIVAQTKSGTYTDYYGPDGTLRRTDLDGKAVGRWMLEDERICFDFPEDDDRTCVRVHVTGETGTFTDESGGIDTFTILPGNARNL